MRTSVALFDATPAAALPPADSGRRSAVGARALVPPVSALPIVQSGTASAIEPSAAGASVAALLVAFVIAALCLASLPQAEAAEVTGSAHGDEAPPAQPRSDSAAAGHCLSRQEQRARIAARTVVPLAKAARAVNGRGDDLLHARLCERDGRLVYLLTVLARGGKVLRAAVDAGSGALINAPH
jgi:uncharacterized membrane protein YkoI